MSTLFAPASRKLIPAALAVALVLFMFIWSTSVKSDTLHWQWRAHRATKNVVTATIADIQKASTGLFGIGGSPSMADALPDPIVVSFAVAGAPAKTSKTLKLKMPRLELGVLKVGDSVTLEFVEDDICVAVLPASASK